MGLMDRLKGVKRPEEGTPALDRGEVERRLLGLSTDQVPFTVQPGTDSDLEVEWRIVDAQWYEIFAKAGLEKGVLRLRPRLDLAPVAVEDVLAGVDELPCPGHRFFVQRV